MHSGPESGARLLEGRAIAGLSPEAAASLARQGVVTYSVTTVQPQAPQRRDGNGKEARRQARARVRLRSAKVIDANNVFLCEALVQDRSPGGMRLLLARNVGLPKRFGVYDDLSGDVATAALAWRRGQTLGVRIQRDGPPSPMTPAQMAALAGHYYAMRD
jgi:hypothetical protein